MSSASVTGIPVNNGPDSLSGLYNRYANALYNYGAGLGFPKDTCMEAIHDGFCKLSRDEDRKNAFRSDSRHPGQRRNLP